MMRPKDSQTKAPAHTLVESSRSVARRQLAPMSRNMEMENVQNQPFFCCSRMKKAVMRKAEKTMIWAMATPSRALKP